MKTYQATRIYISRINENLGKDRTEYLLQYLSKENIERFHKFHFIKDSLRTLCGEIIVRAVISKQFDIKNDQIKIEKNFYGKPYIPNLPIHFSISHAGDWVVCAFSTRNIGIDIEQIKDIQLDIAERFFSREEYNFLMEKEESERQESFYDLWTLKESYIKWIGSGLSTPLDSFYFTISDKGISVVNPNEVDIPYFKQYSVDGYKLSVCSTVSAFPDNMNLINIDEIVFN